MTRTLTAIGIWGLVAATCAPAAASEPVNGSPATAIVSVAPVPVEDGLTSLPGEVIESPAPPPAETIEYYVTDGIGSTRVVFAPDGNVIGRGDFLPYGEELPGANLPPERFTGQARDTEAAQDY